MQQTQNQPAQTQASNSMQEQEESKGGQMQSSTDIFAMPQPIFSDQIFQSFSSLAVQASSSTDPQVQVQANQELVRMIGAQTQPIAFLFHLLLQDGAHEQVVVAAAELVRGHIKVTTFAEFQCQVPNIEQTFAALITRMLAPNVSERLLTLLVRLICSLAAEYWLDSQCFENFFTEKLHMLQAQNNRACRLLLLEILVSIKTLVASCEGSSHDQQSEGVDQDLREDHGSSGATTSSQTDSLNHKAFKTVQLFKSSALLAIFQLVHLKFTNLMAQNGSAAEVVEEVHLLTDVLKLHKLKISHGRNQMQFKLILKDEQMVIQQKISSFCAPQNISQLVHMFIINDNLFSDEDCKMKAGELIRCMIALTLNASSDSDQAQIEVDRAPYSALLASLLSVITSGRLPRDSVIKLVHRCNYSLFSIAEATVQTQWLNHLTELLPSVTQSFENLKFGQFQLIVNMWKPITKIIDQGDTTGQLSVVGPFLTEQAKRLTVLLLKSIEMDQTFEDGDPFEEELSNPKGVKEIAQAITQLTMLSPLAYLTSLKQLLAQVMVPSSSQPKQIESLCWLIHLLRVLYAQLFPLLNPENASKIVTTQSERLQSATQCAEILLNLKPQVEQSVAQLLPTIDQSLAGCLQLAVMKAVECLARSLLSRQIRYDSQAEYVNHVAQSAGLESKDNILTSLIQFALMTLSATSTTGSKSQINLIEKSALKILVQLTCQKPMVSKETRTMKIKHFDVNFQTLVALKDYLCNVLQGTNGQAIRRQAIKSLVELMTEFDTMSDCQEVITAIYGQISQSIEQVSQISPSVGQTVGIIGHVENLRGVYEGTYRQSQFMALVKSFMAEPPVGMIRARLEYLLDQGNQGTGAFANINERAKFVKNMLGLAQEMSFNRDCRMGFVEHTCQQMQFLQCQINLVQKCLKIVRDFNMNDPQHQQTAMSLLKRAMKVCLYLGLNEIMNAKQMEMLQGLKNQFQATLSLLIEGLKTFVPPLQVNQLKQSTQGLVFKLIYLLFERHFNLVLSLAQRDISYFDYMLELLAEGIQSTQSTSFLSSVESFEVMYNRGWKNGNPEFRTAMIQIISGHPRTAQVFKMLLKQNLRTFIRGEQTNLKWKIQVTLRLITMYLSIQETQLYPICASEVAKEASNGSQEIESATYAKLIDLMDNMDWKRKRIEPNVKQVLRKLVPPAPKTDDIEPQAAMVM